MPSQNNKYKLLLSNTVIFAIGNVLVKLISFFLMPLYTSVLSTDQYGISELLNSAVEIMLPIITICIVEALYRFAIDQESNKKAMFSSAVIIVLLGDIVVILASLLLKNIMNYQYAYELCLLYVTVSLYKLTTQFSRGLGHSKRFALYGVINSLILVISNLLLLVELDGGVKEYLLSFSIAYGCTATIAFFFSKEYKFINIKSFDRVLLREMLRYGLPDIPNTLSWWVNSVSDRYILLFFCGAGISGIYTAASKLPAMINLVTSIFQQAWQYSTVKEYDKQDSNMFFNNVFRIYSYFCFLMCAILVISNKLLCKLLLKDDFYYAWKYVPLLLLAATFGCLASYFGSFYGAIKNNVAAMKSTIIGAFANFVLNLILIPIYGGYGAAIATAVSYALIVALRYTDLRKRLRLDITCFRTIIQASLLIVLVIISTLESTSVIMVASITIVIMLGISDVYLIKLIYGYIRRQIIKISHHCRKK